jgi:hypothetical protein
MFVLLKIKNAPSWMPEALSVEVKVTECYGFVMFIEPINAAEKLLLL